MLWLAPVSLFILISDARDRIQTVPVASFCWIQFLLLLLAELVKWYKISHYSSPALKL